MNTKQQGYTLAELMIVVLILAILATIAFPSYQNYIRQTRLSAVRSDLVQNAQTLERFYAQQKTFVGFDGDNLKQSDYFDISFTDADDDSTNPSDSGFILQAEPNDSNDIESCTVYLNDSGIFWATSSDSGKTCPGFEEPSK